VRSFFFLVQKHQGKAPIELLVGLPSFHGVVVLPALFRPVAENEMMPSVFFFSIVSVFHRSLIVAFSVFFFLLGLNAFVLLRLTSVLSLFFFGADSLFSFYFFRLWRLLVFAFPLFRVRWQIPNALTSSSRPLEAVSASPLSFHRIFSDCAPLPPESKKKAFPSRFRVFYLLHFHDLIFQPHLPSRQIRRAFLFNDPSLASFFRFSMAFCWLNLCESLRVFF